ncbi:hypothetical protein GCM10020220_048470 [Nonomuraea rubra]
MGPERIMAVRHGESEANLAHRQAGETPLVYERGDDEVTVTELGRAQAAALGRLLAALPAPRGAGAGVVLAVPARARHLEDRPGGVGRRAAARHPSTIGSGTRSRARSRTSTWPRSGSGTPGSWPGARPRAPTPSARRAASRWPTSWCGCAGFLRDLDGRAAGRRVLIVAHDSVVLALRHVLDRRPDAELAAVLEFAPVLNASVSLWRTGELVSFNDVTHLTS